MPIPSALASRAALLLAAILTVPAAVAHNRAGDGTEGAATYADPVVGTRPGARAAPVPAPAEAAEAAGASGLSPARLPDDTADRSMGAMEFLSNCAVCHGPDARGDGPYAMYLKGEPADLTTLARDNGGSFPFEEVYRVIDGRVLNRAHGPREMPVWGFEYNAQARDYYDEMLGPRHAESYVTTRILALIRYLDSIQQE
jgi:mono/diheme cytochrome c family protein